MDAVPTLVLGQAGGRGPRELPLGRGRSGESRPVGACEGLAGCQGPAFARLPWIPPLTPHSPQLGTGFSDDALEAQHHCLQVRGVGRGATAGSPEVRRA